jgi:hypothetical protein
MSGFAVRQETDDVAAATLVRIAVTGVAVGAVGVFVAGALLWATAGALRPDFAGPGGARVVERTLGGVEQTPIWDSKVGLDLERKQRRELERWGWVDRPRGIASIPIEEAMDIVAIENGR